MKKNGHQLDLDAKFIGWQIFRLGKHIALYNITLKGHPLQGSTVTKETLLKLNLRIPNGN